VDWNHKSDAQATGQRISGKMCFDGFAPLPEDRKKMQGNPH
jgi:hypothetical protein